MYNEALFNAYEREHELLARLERQDGDLEGLEDYTRELEGAVEDLQFDVRNMEDEIAILKADLDASKSLEASDLIYMIRLEEGNAVLRGQAERDLWTIKALEDQVGDLARERDELIDAVQNRDDALVRITTRVLDAVADLEEWVQSIKTLNLPPTPWEMVHLANRLKGIK